MANIESSIVDVLHSEMGYDLPMAYAVGLALEHGNHQPEVGTLQDLQPENIEMIKQALVKLADGALDEHQGIIAQQNKGELPVRIT